MKQRNVVVKNGFFGILSQVVKIVFTFLTRSLFIHYIGIEILGINSTFASVLSTLSVTELGFQTAVAFSLYKPLHEGNKDEINDIMNIFRIVYRCVGVFFVVASFVLLPFLKYILKDIQVTRTVWLYFLLQSAASAFTYFIAYKRTLLYADQKDYIAKSIDTVVTIVFNALQCIALVLLRDYITYLVLRIVQVVVSNLFIHLYCTKHYSFLHPSLLNKGKLREIWENVKNVFVGRIAGYIYRATDNIIISSFVGTVSVGLLVNYTTITTSLKNLTNSLLTSMTPIIGHYLVDENSEIKRKKVFDLYAYVMFFVASATVIPLLVLEDDFISWWVGRDMVMEWSIPLLIAIDYYIHLVHGCLLEFVNGAGLFKVEKKVEVAGAITNIVTSLVLVQFMGIPGVLLGTVISQLVFWFGRSWIVFFRCLGQHRKDYFMYWIRNLICAAVFCGMFFACSKIYKLLSIQGLLPRVIIGGLLCEMLILVGVPLIFSKTVEQKQAIRIIRGMVGEKLKDIRRKAK